MPMIDADGCLLNVTVEGRDGGPTLMLSNSLGSTLQMWEPQMRAFTQVFRVIRYDQRGHGKSQVPPGPYSIERFGRDALAILDDLNIEKVHWCGVSMGGMAAPIIADDAPSPRCFASSAMIGAAMANRRCRPAPTPSNDSAAMRWPFWTISTSRRCIGAASRWAAWSGNGSRPTPPGG